MVFILALGSQAIAGVSALNIRTHSNAPLKVIIDGHVVSNSNSMVQINSITPGKHMVQVFQVLNSYHGNNEQRLFFGEVYLPQNTVTNALIKHQQFIIEEQFALQVKPSHNRPPHAGQGNYYETKPVTWSVPQHNTNQGYGNSGQYGSQHGNQGYGSQGHGYNQGSTHTYYTPPVAVVPVRYPMSGSDFNSLKAAIENQWFSDGKILVVKQAISDGHLFNTNQVKNLIGLFSFSGDRLEVAKMAYHNTVDNENYFQVYDSFQYSSSVRKLSSYIASL